MKFGLRLDVYQIQERMHFTSVRGIEQPSPQVVKECTATPHALPITSSFAHDHTFKVCGARNSNALANPWLDAQ